MYVMDVKTWECFSTLSQCFGRFLQGTRISFHPKSYLISRHFYNKNVPSTIVRTRVNEQSQKLIQNLLKMHTTNVENILAKKPDIAESEIQGETTKLINKMDNNDHNWQDSSEKHETKAVTLIVPLPADNRGLFVSFNVWIKKFIFLLTHRN